MFDERQYQATARRLIGANHQQVTLKVNNGAGFDEYPGVKANVSYWRETDLIPGSSVEVGDLKLIILAETVPDAVGDLEQRDRVEIGGENYAVMYWDTQTGRVNNTVVTILAAVRG